MIYVGANDGMLHAFHAEGDQRGTEAFAYIPGSVFPRLRQLASQTYGHQFYVDGSPSMGDAYFAPSGRGRKAWRTVVAGGLNKGGQAIYALDVTDPAGFDEHSILWEFTDADDRDLGFTYSQPIVQKLHDGQWYVIFGNGYNSMASDAHPSLTGNAVLYLVDIETGVATKLDTGVGPGRQRLHPVWQWFVDAHGGRRGRRSPGRLRVRRRPVRQPVEIRSHRCRSGVMECGVRTATSVHGT